MQETFASSFLQPVPSIQELLRVSDEIAPLG